MILYYGKPKGGVNLKETQSILRDVRAGVGLGEDVNHFDTDLLMHINAAIVRLNQNGVGNLLVVQDENLTWGDLKNPEQVKGNEIFPLVPLYVTMSTKLIFDPPPPSNVDYYADSVREMLWRLKIGYETGGE